MGREAGGSFAWKEPGFPEAAGSVLGLDAGVARRIGLIGVCGSPANPVFTLPEGFRPAAADVALPVSKEDVVSGNVELTTLSVDQNGTVSVQARETFDLFSLNGLSFRCGPSGADGCP